MVEHGHALAIFQSVTVEENGITQDQAFHTARDWNAAVARSLNRNAFLRAFLPLAVFNLGVCLFTEIFLRRGHQSLE